MIGLLDRLSRSPGAHVSHFDPNSATCLRMIQQGTSLSPKRVNARSLLVQNLTQKPWKVSVLLPTVVTSTTSDSNVPEPRPIAMMSGLKLTDASLQIFTRTVGLYSSKNATIIPRYTNISSVYVSFSGMTRSCRLNKSVRNSTSTAVGGSTWTRLFCVTI